MNYQIQKSIELIKSFKVKKVSFLGFKLSRLALMILRNSPTLNVIDELLER